MSEVLDRLKAALADRYAIECEIGSGGMAVVYLAKDLRHERRVAIKVLRPELTSVVAAERFLREIKLTAGLTHPHVLPLLDSGEADGLLYYAMPFVEGESLRERLEREKQLRVDEALRIAREVADALSYAHSRDVLHRDIKPENILLAEGHAVVADFGIAKALSEAAGDKLTDTGVSIGTTAYMSPEQAAGERELSAASDVYSLACVLYEMLAGEPPVVDTSVQKIVSRKLLGRFRPLGEHRPEVSGEIDAAVSRALATEPAERFGSGGEFAEAMGPAVPAAAHSRRARVPRTIAVVAAVVLVTALSAWIVRYRATTSWKRVPLDPDAVAVMPFRVTATDPALAGLDEGIVDLLYTVFTGDVGPRAIEPNALLLAWQERQMRGVAGIADAPVRLAAHFGAGLLLAGALVQAGPEVTLNAWLQRVPGGEALARHTVTGSPDSIHVLVRQLAVGVMGSQLGESAERLAGLDEHSPQAIRAYLAGTRAYREGKYGEAIRLLDRAIELDSTLALAGLRLAEAGGLSYLTSGFGPFVARRGLRVARPLRGTLSRRDQAAVTALMLLNAADTASSWVGQLEALRAWVDLATDDALAWRRYAEVLRQSGSVIGIPNWEGEARQAFERAWAIDSTTAAAVEDHVQAAILTEDIEWLQRVGPRYLAVADTSGDYWTANRWAIALALGDSSTVRELRARARAGNLREHPWPVLWRLWTIGRTLGSPQAGDEEILLEQFRSSSRTGIDTFWLMHYEVKKGIETGRLRHVAELLGGPMGPYWGGREGRKNFALDYWLLYPGFDSLVTVWFDSLQAAVAAQADSSNPMRLCYVQLYRAARADTVGAREAARRLYPRWRERFAEGICPALVEAMVEAQDQGREESPALDRLEALLRAGNYGREAGTTPAVPFLARQRRLRGELERGLAVARMRGLSTSYYLQMQPALFKEEGDLAAIVGDTAGAIDAYTRYLNLRTDPDPELQPQVDSVRVALDRLLKDED